MSHSIVKALSILLTSALAGNATTWYVSTSGSDSNSGKSSSAAYATPAKGIAAASAGDTVLIMGGTYSISSRIVISTSGTAAKPIHLLAEDAYSKRAVFDFSSMSEGSSNQGVQLKGNYWHMKGIDIQYAGDNGMLVDGGSYDTIEWCSFRYNHDAGMQLRHGATHDYILNCDSYWNYDSATLGGNADGFAPKLDVGDSIVFVGCRAWGNSDDGWDGYLKTAGTSYPDNVTTVLENCWAFHNGYYHDDESNSKNNSEMNGNGIKMGGSPNKDQRHPHIVKRCLSFGNKSKQFDQNNNPGSMTLLNCTAYGSGNNFVISMSLTTGCTLTVSNCLSLGGGKVSLISAAVQATNSWSSGFSASTSDVQSVDTTGVRGARQKDGSLPEVTFMHLKAGSSLIDAGTVISGMTYSGSKPDLGAFETTASTTGIVATSAELPALQILNVAGDLRLAASLSAASSVRVTVSDLMGRTLRTASMALPAGASVASLNVSGLRSGLYLVHVTAAGMSQSARFTVR